MRAHRRGGRVALAGGDRHAAPVGTLEVGDTAIAVVAGSGHRAAAFDACRYVVDEVKRRLPIWKQEFYADGTHEWVDHTAVGRSIPAESA